MTVMTKSMTGAFAALIGVTLVASPSLALSRRHPLRTALGSPVTAGESDIRVDANGQVITAPTKLKSDATMPHSLKAPTSALPTDAKPIRTSVEKEPLARLGCVPGNGTIHSCPPVAGYQLKPAVNLRPKLTRVH